MKRLLYFLMLVELCACSSGKTVLPNGVYNVKLGEIYTESQMIEALNKDTFRSFRVYDNGGGFMPGRHDTFYRSEKDGIIHYSASNASRLPEFSFCECSWSKFSIDTKEDGQLIRFAFSKGTLFSPSSFSSIKSGYETLLTYLQGKYGKPEVRTEDEKILHEWEDSTTKMIVEYCEFTDYKNEPGSVLSCALSLSSKE